MKLGKIVICFLYLNTALAFGQDREVSITIDDLPATTTGEVSFKYVTENLLKTLSNYNIPAIGFVNENKLYADGKPDSTKIGLLEEWIRHGMELGNHSYSHIYINNATLEEYSKDVIKGEIITRPLLHKYRKQLKYYRHTQLRTGPTESYRKGLNAFLQGRGYTIAPVTIDNDEYIYAYCYEKAEQNNHPPIMKEIGKDYLEYMTRIFTYYETLSKQFLGYEPKQTLLLHANRLNADYLDELVVMLKQRGYHFISLDEALNDQAYKRSEGTHPRGPSWVHRWMKEAGVMIENPQPPISGYISELYNSYRNE